MRKHMSHYDFIKKIGLAWLKPADHWSTANINNANKNKISRTVSSTNSSSVMGASTIAESAATRRKIIVNNKKNSTINNKALDPYSGILRCRLNSNLNHLPIRNDKPENNCQLCYWISKQKVRAQLMKCCTCNVTLCIDCYKKFHEVAQLQPNN